MAGWAAGRLIMGTQFANVSCTHGAPMGRREDGYLETRVRGFVRLFRVRLNSGGYDDGGAYWGTGEALWCALDGDGNRQFVRAPSRFLAAVKLDIPARALRSGLAGWSDTYCHYADNRHLLERHGISTHSFVEWAKWSGAAMGQDPRAYRMFSRKGA